MDGMVDVSSVSLVLIVTILWFLSKSILNRLKYNLPPSASVLNHVPIVGYIPFVDLETFHEQAMNLGPIVRYRFGFDDVVVVNDFDLIKEVSTRDELQDRPDNFIFRLLGNSELLINWSGKLWRSQRNFSLRSLRGLGFGKRKFEEKIHDEIKYMIDTMDSMKECSTGIKIKKLLGPSVSNIIMLMTIGHRYDFDHPIRQRVDKYFLDENNSVLDFFSVKSHFTKIMKFLISLIPAFLIPNLKEYVTFLPDMITGIAVERSKVIESMSGHELDQESDCFIDSYLKHMKIMKKSSDEKNEKQYFTVDNGRACAQSFFTAGTATMQDAVEWIFALLAAHQDVQGILFKEIDSVTGSTRLVTIDDKINLPMTESFILEFMRYACQVPMNVPHSASRDTKIAGYDIPKGTHIHTNLWAVNMNEKYWKEAKSFKYDRFLSVDRTKCIKSDHLMPFGYGKRSCPGESMAMLEIFLYTVTFIQSFKILPSNETNIICPYVTGHVRNVNRNLILRFLK